MYKLYVLLMFLRNLSTNDEVVDYYENLIKEGIQNSTTYQLPKNASGYKPDNETIIDFGLYDFVIVGGGSAGAVIANRLTSNYQWSVLLLEAGGDETPFTDIPYMSRFTLKSEYNWGFSSIPQNSCCLETNGVCPYPRGKGLGGTSILNALVYARGNKRDFDNWEAAGNPGWSYEDVLPYFKKSENSNIHGDVPYHGFNGYLNVEYHRPTSNKINVFLRANNEQSRPTGDYNGKEQLVASRIQFNTNKGRRGSSSRAFIDPVRNRINLNILLKSYVTKVLIDSDNKAYGVQFSHNKQNYVVRVMKEVILSAGVIGSPHILMLSGVGPSGHLQKHGIPVFKDLAVGQNLHDHLTFYTMYFSTPIPEPIFTLRNSIKEYLKGRGPLTISTNPQGIAFIDLGLTMNSSVDIEIVMVPATNTHELDVARTGAIHGNVRKKYSRYWQNTSNDKNVFQMIAVLLHPKTRGGVYLKSNDPYEYPLIDSRCLEDYNNEDIENIYRGIQSVLNLLDTEAFKTLKAQLLPLPLCTEYSSFSREYWICLIRQTAMNAYHGGGTCSMGLDPSKGAVVDNKLRVHGIENLRVADSSVIPITLSGHMNAPAMMVGERLSDFIIETHMKL